MSRIIEYRHKSINVETRGTVIISESFSNKELVKEVKLES